MPTTADLMDKDQGELQCCELQLRGLSKRRSFSGFIRTVRCREDNKLLADLLGEPGEGHVLVVDGGGELRSALLGHRLATRGSIHGWAGVIINGAVRDLAALAELDFGVKALGSSPRRSGEKGYGKVDVDVSFGGVMFTPGHWVCSDDDGIVVAPPPETEPKTTNAPKDATTREYDIQAGASEVESPHALAVAGKSEQEEARKTSSGQGRRRKRTRLGDRLRDR
jgi:regulator of ribonuclease activity A